MNKTFYGHTPNVDGLLNLDHSDAVPKHNGKVYTPPPPTSINPWLARNNECLQLATSPGEFRLQLF